MERGWVDCIIQKFGTLLQVAPKYHQVRLLLCNDYSSKITNCIKSELDKTINKLDYSKCTPKCKDITITEEGDTLHMVCECKNTEHFIDTPKYYYGCDKVVFHKSVLEEILNTNLYPSGSKVCICNMSGLFHEDIDPQDLALVFEYMFKRKDLTFQILTKQPERMLESIKENIKIQMTQSIFTLAYQLKIKLYLVSVCLRLQKLKEI